MACSASDRASPKTSDLVLACRAKFRFWRLNSRLSKWSTPVCARSRAKSRDFLTRLVTRAPFDGQLRLADVVYVDHSSWLQTLFLFLPGRQASESSTVTAPEGLVGRVILSEGPYSKVQLITDRASGIGAMIERTRRQGIARGAGRSGLSLEYVPLQADVQVGDRVLTSGTDGLYPRGVPIGVVAEVGPGTELFHSIRLEPAVDFGMLDQVFVAMGDALPGKAAAITSASP